MRRFGKHEKLCKHIKASAKWEEREMSKFRHARCFLRVAGGADEVAQNGKLKLFIWLLHKIEDRTDAMDRFA